MKGIPHICHLTWTKDSPMSLLQTFTVVSFHKYNPDWRIIVHVVKQTVDQLGKNTYVPDYTGVDHFHLVANLPYVEIHEVHLDDLGIKPDKFTAAISDILRIHYLYTVGGVYSDFDMIWLRPMSEFINITKIGNPADFETTACFYEGTYGHHNNSNIVSQPGGKYLLSILEEQKLLKPPYTHQAFNTDLLNRLYPTYHDIVKRFPKVLAIAYQTFYPYSIYNLDLLYKYNVLNVIKPKGVIGVHWFNGHAISQQYASTNQYTSRCSMTSILKREGLV